MNAEERAEQIAGMRQLIDFLEAHPVIPLPTGVTRFAYYPKNSPGGQDVPGALAELRKIASSLGVEPSSPYGKHVYVTWPKFRGGVEFEAIVCDAEELFKQQEAARDFARGGGEVPGPVAAGPGTAQDEPGDETVWTAGKRKGINYHAIDSGNPRTVCGRSILYGVELPRRRAAEYATPCPRCYRAGVA